MNRDLSKRTDGEELWLWRRREGLTQAAAAKLRGCCRSTYWRYESDRLELSAALKPWSRPSIALQLVLARRRYGRGLRGTAALVSCSHVNLLAREAAGDPELRAWWAGRGFTFV